MPPLLEVVFASLHLPFPAAEMVKGGQLSCFLVFF